ncbi:uncharacterized protein LOC106644282 isoform X3 [Copidosoma floridanum]|uniref:uncharacterized protein LOC106644282 isoform X3 n=1 Tax=Copidosoma floridanum TaxID=29053 RepID=UPI0006C9CD16|nr:uncharacterized protein LOC106644282 isoform X3 [Copidosoma floridanum]
MSSVLQTLFAFPNYVLKRNLYVRSACSYESDGKTTVTILNKNFDYGLMIDNVICYVFKLPLGLNFNKIML